MRYDDKIIDQVQSAHDIVEVIGQYVKLKKNGRNYKGLCPFHGEKTPSFMVQPEKQIFHCFGCSAGGDVFGFIMKHENLSFPEAIRQLADRAGIALPKWEKANDQASQETDQLYDIYRIAADFYHEKFKTGADAKAARDYFLKRGYTMQTAEEFKIGWASEDWQQVFEFLSKKGFSETILLKSSLVSRSAKGRTYDTFRGRILFPIQNLQGKFVAFGGRILKDVEGAPKYLNSPENPVFQKRKELFGLNVAKKFIDRDTPKILVVEGYFDFLGLYNAGFKNTVATLGTALGDDHVRVLKRFADEAIVVYDGDKAGEAASLRGLEVFIEGGMNVRIARMPAGFDPDDFVKKNGNEAFQKVLDEARDFFDYKMEILLTRYNRLDSLGLMKITSDFLETFSKIDNSVLLDRYLRRLASSLGVEENSLRSELDKLKKKTFDKPGSSALTVSKPAQPNTKTETSEETILVLLTMEDVNIRAFVFEQLREADFLDPDAREAFSKLLEIERGGGSIVWPQILNRLENEDFKRKIVSLASLDWNDQEKKQGLEDCFKTLYKKRNQKKLEEIRRLIAKAEHEKDSAKVGDLMREYQELWKQTL